MNFGDALTELKAGKRVSRAGWNGKGMWLSLPERSGATEDAEYQVSQDMLLTRDGQYYTMGPWIGMKTADNKFVPWLASQTDILAEDWSLAP